MWNYKKTRNKKFKATNGSRDVEFASEPEAYLFCAARNSDSSIPSRDKTETPEQYRKNLLDWAKAKLATKK